MRPGITIVLLAGAAVGATGLYFVRSLEREPAAGGMQLVRPEGRTMANVVNATGTIRLRVGSEVRVGAQLSGIVTKLNVTVGGHVRAGDIVAEIDDAALQARLADADAQAELDRAGMERVRVNHERARRLASQGLIAAQQEEDLQLALQEAKARYEKSLRARDLVKVDLTHVQVRVPISGVVASISTQEGETVAASFTAPTFVTIIADNALQLIAMVDETDIANVKAGNPVHFTVDSFPSRDFPGIVASVAPKASIVSGVVNYEVTVNIKKDIHLLKPDMTANVAIQTARHEAMVLPAVAVQRDGEQRFVLVSDKSGLQRRPVVLGNKVLSNKVLDNKVLDNKEDDMIEIKRGISPGDQVAVPTPGGIRTQAKPPS